MCGLLLFCGSCGRLYSFSYFAWSKAEFFLEDSGEVGDVFETDIEAGIRYTATSFE